MLAAVILVGAPALMKDRDATSSTPQTPEVLAGNQIACLEILGESVLDRTIRRLQAAGVRAITVIADVSLSHLVPLLASRHVEIGLTHRLVDLWHVADRKLRECGAAGAEHVLVIRLGAYAEFDLQELLQFHRDQCRQVTRVYDRRGPLDCWVVNSARFRQAPSKLRAMTLKTDAAFVSPYSLGGYVNRLRDAQDLRRLVVDAFLSRCAIVPAGSEARPGVWLDQGAQVHRRARVVAPTYIGKGAQVHAFALITRFSNLECGCDVDCGTVVEDSSLLANTYIGAGLDVCHAVVCGGTLAHLGHNVTIELNDEKLAGHTTYRRTFAGNASRTSSPARVFGGLLAAGWRRQILSLTGTGHWAD